MAIITYIQTLFDVEMITVRHIFRLKYSNEHRICGLNRSADNAYVNTIWYMIYICTTLPDAYDGEEEKVQKSKIRRLNKMTALQLTQFLIYWNRAGLFLFFFFSIHLFLEPTNGARLNSCVSYRICIHIYLLIYHVALVLFIPNVWFLMNSARWNCLIDLFHIWSGKIILADLTEYGGIIKATIKIYSKVW